MKLRIGIPKGSLQESTLRLFRNAGYTIKLAERSYVPVIDDPELEGLVIRAQEMGRYVENGILDMGITGLDWVLEQNSKVKEVARLRYSKVGFKGVKWVVAVPNDSPIKNIRGLKGKVIATELVGFTTRFLKAQKIDATVEYSWGATEAKPPRLADAIVEVTETGTTLKANGLKIVHTLLETNTKLIANKAAMKDAAKRRKIQHMALLLRGALAAENLVGIKMNVPESSFEEVVGLLPSLTSPTVARLHDSAWFSVEIVIRESVVRELVPRLIEKGATGIIEYPLNKVVNREDAI